MKKVLLSLIIIVLGVLAYLMMARGITAFGVKIETFVDLKQLNGDVDKKISEISKLTSQGYTAEVDTLTTAIKSLNTTKQTYQSKTTVTEDAETEGIVSVDNYKIEYLWKTLGTYNEDRNVSLKLDVESNKTTGNYDLAFIVVGTYKNVADFMDDIIGDDTFNFRISNFSMIPYTSTESKQTQAISSNIQSSSSTVQPYDSTTTSSITDSVDSSASSSATTYNPNRVKAQFKVEDVDIEF